MAIDALSKRIISFRITKGNVHDSKKFSPMIREVSKEYDIDKVSAHKAQDNRDTFNLNKKERIN